jgi:hypothetical protein
LSGSIIKSQGGYQSTVEGAVRPPGIPLARWKKTNPYTPGPNELHPQKLHQQTSMTSRVSKTMTHPLILSNFGAAKGHLPLLILLILINLNLPVLNPLSFS